MRTVRLVVLRGHNVCVRTAYNVARTQRVCAHERSRVVSARVCFVHPRVCVCSFVCVSKRRRMCVYLCLCACGCVLTPHVRVRQVRYVACKQESRASNGRHADRRVQPPRAVLRGTSTAVGAHCRQPWLGRVHCVCPRTSSVVRRVVHPSVRCIAVRLPVREFALSCDMLLHCAALCARSNYSREYFRAQ